MNPSTPKFGLPLLAMGQAQKDVTHNEALLLVDLLLGGAVVSRSIQTPPEDPEPGQVWIVPLGAAGPWASRAGDLAAWTPGGWRFLRAADGFSLFVIDEGRRVRRLGSAWVAEPPFAFPPPSVTPPSGGTTVDAEARAAVAELQALLRSLGFVT